MLHKPRIMASIHLDAEPHRVFNYLTRPANFPEVWPCLVSVRDIRRQPDGSHSFDWVRKMGGVCFMGHTATVRVETDRRIAWKSERGIPSYSVCNLEPEAGGTRVAVEVEYVVPRALLDQLPDKFIHETNANDLRAMLLNLKLRMELVAHAQQQPALSSHG